MIVYLIRNTINGKCYVGKTSRGLMVRWREHCRHARNGLNPHWPLHVDLQAFGVAAFEVLVLGEADCQRRLNQIERKFIRQFNAVTSGYNQSEGANGGRTKLRRGHPSRELPAIQKVKIAETLRLFHASRKQASA